MSSLKDDAVKLQIIELDKAGLSGRSISDKTGVPRSSIGDFLRKETYQNWWAAESAGAGLHGGGKTNLAYGMAQDIINSPRFDGVLFQEDTSPTKPLVTKQSATPVHIVTSKEAPDGCTHIMIPDLQVKPGIDMSYLKHHGEYIASKKPDVIINIGDHFDLPSLSVYDKGTKKAEGKHLQEDIDAGIIGMNMLLQPIADLQARELEMYGEIRYKPKMVFCIGNHEQRLERHVNAHPELTGLVGYEDFLLHENGWEVYDFLEPAVVNGVMYIHYMPNPMTGKPYGGQALSILKNVGCSVSMGHKQTFDMAVRYLPTGQQQCMLICGAGYPHDEGYKGYTGNKHFRGLIVKHRVSNGGYNLMMVDLEYLEKKYNG